MRLKRRIELETLRLLRQGTNLGAALRNDPHLPLRWRRALCGHTPVGSSRLVQLDGEPTLCMGKGWRRLRLALILSDDDHRAATYLPCAACWPSCMAEGNR
jgi:hypothetical protein